MEAPSLFLLLKKRFLKNSFLNSLKNISLSFHREKFFPPILAFLFWGADLAKCLLTCPTQAGWFPPLLSTQKCTPLPPSLFPLCAHVRLLIKDASKSMYVNVVREYWFIFYFIFLFFSYFFLILIYINLNPSIKLNS